MYQFEVRQREKEQDELLRLKRLLEKRDIWLKYPKKLKPGMVVYDVRKASGLHRFNGKWQIWSVYIEQIDEENEKVLASWNGNKPAWYHKHTWSKWRIKLPI